MYRVFFHNPCDYIIRKPLTYYMFPLREIIKNKRILESHRSTIDRLYNVYKYSLYKGLVKCNRIPHQKLMSDIGHTQTPRTGRPNIKGVGMKSSHLSVAVAAVDENVERDVSHLSGRSCCRGWGRWARRSPNSTGRCASCRLSLQVSQQDLWHRRVQRCANAVLSLLVFRLRVQTRQIQIAGLSSQCGGAVKPTELYLMGKYKY